MTDLYEEIGVERGATEKEIRRAYRRRAKEAHPDAGGDGEAFARLGTALAVLTDPERRRRYDETGEVDDGPDNDRAAALQVIQRHMAAITMEFLRDWNPTSDPRQVDVPELIRLRVQTEVRQATLSLEGGRRVVAFLRDMEGRFKRKRSDGEPNALALGFRQQVEQNERQIAQIEHSIRVHALAIELVSAYDFERDLPAPTFDTPGLMRWSFGR